MKMNLKELKETKMIINIFMIVALAFLLISIISNIYHLEGIILNDTDDSGDKMGIRFLENLKVYHFILPLNTDKFALYFSWEIMSLYIVLILAFVMSFIDIGKYDHYKQNILGGILIIISVILIVFVAKYKNELQLIYDEFAGIYFEGSYVNAENGSIPFLAFFLAILSGLLAQFKGWILVRMKTLDKKKKWIKQ